MSETQDGLYRLRNSVAEGLLYTHSRLNSSTSKILETASFLYALIDVLSESGVVSIEELDDRKKSVGQRLAAEFKKQGAGVMLQDPEYDKYSFNQEAKCECSRRLPLCRAACCRLPFALARQDIMEGIVRWSLGEPYLIDQCEDGYCCHMERGTLGCTIYKHRPVPCRAFDCRNDTRIWVDFEQMVVNPLIRDPGWPGCLVNHGTDAVEE